MLRREQLKAAEEKRAVRRLTSFDLLKGIDDASRMGSFRFAETPGGDFINCETDFRVPPFTKINELMLAAHEIEASEAKSILPKEKWINQLIHPGTSLGGARPKASVLDEDGKLTVAKFPSRKELMPQRQKPFPPATTICFCRGGLIEPMTESEYILPLL